MQSPDTPYVNIAAYKFITFDDTAEKRPQFLEFCQKHNLRGTILLTPEGINLFLAGLRHEIDAFLAWLRADERFADIVVKESFSEKQPFTRMLVKLKAEIITMKHPLIKPEEGRAPSVEPQDLKRWLDQGHDDAGRPVVMVDTRNAFEVDVGTFDNTVDYRIAKFTEFPQVIADHKPDFDGKTVVTFCTGGIRCEKATAFMKEQGFDEVYHLKGGILKYLEEVPAEESLWEGACFVFDERVSIEHGLKQGNHKLCHACRNPITAEEITSPKYEEGVSCSHCYDTRTEEDRLRYRQRQLQIALAKKRGERHIGS